jgi:DNA-directed RNA polymerase III subunit RPC6
MATPHVTASPTPGPSDDPGCGLIADAIYEYCREYHDPGEILVQEHLLKPDIIPSKDLNILLQVCQHLVDNHLFKTHEIKGGGIGWKLVTRESAENYKDLSRDEKMVYSAIDSSGTKGIWTKIIKERLNIHAKVVERAFKSLEGKGLIEQMKDVKFPGRKMFIKRGLKPNEEATGGAWFTDGELDTLMIDLVATVIEKLIGDKSWVEEKPAPSPGPVEHMAPSSPDPKRKAPHDGFDQGKGKQKVARTTEESDSGVISTAKSRTKSQTPAKSYALHPPGYQSYPTLAEITDEINRKGLMKKGLLPQNAVSQLLEVMVYDDKLVKIVTTADMDTPSRIMFRTVKNPAQILTAAKLEQRLQSQDEGTRKAAMREKELEDIGEGGITEVPCMRCPVFDFCEEGGPVNPTTCVYFDDWFQKLEELRLKDGEIM